MEEKLRKYIEDLFADTTPSRRALELKEELAQNLNEKYRDLIADGKTPEAAYSIAVAGIGDISGLLSSLERDSSVTAVLDEQRKKSARNVAIAVMLYITSCVPAIIISELGFSGKEGTVISILWMFLSCAAATGLLIYNGMTKVKPQKGDTVVEEFRRWQSESNDKKQLRHAISGAMWSIIVVLYLIISFTTWAWSISWIIFVIGGAIEAIINVFVALKSDK